MLGALLTELTILVVNPFPFESLQRYFPNQYPSIPSLLANLYQYLFLQMSRYETCIRLVATGTIIIASSALLYLYYAPNGGKGGPVIKEVAPRPTDEATVDDNNKVPRKTIEVCLSDIQSIENAIQGKYILATNFLPANLSSLIA